MADLTSDQLQVLIDGNYTALNNALTDPKPNYSIGGRSVNHADYIKMLTENMLNLMGMKAAIPSETVTNFDSEIDNTGTDNTEYEGDDNV